MYCRNCGKKINDTAVFCRYCGAKIKDQASNIHREMNGKKYRNSKAGKKNSNKKKVQPAIIGAVEVIVVIVFLVSIFLGKKGNQSSAENVAIAAEKYMLEQDIDKYYSLLAPPYERYMVGSGSWYKDADEFKRTLLEWDGGYRNEMINRCGEDLKITYEVEKDTLYDEEELKLVQFELSRDYEYDVDEIKAAAVVDVLIKGSGSEGEANWTHEIYCVKINGKWYIHRPGFS